MVTKFLRNSMGGILGPGLEHLARHIPDIPVSEKPTALICLFLRNRLLIICFPKLPSRLSCFPALPW